MDRTFGPRADDEGAAVSTSFRRARVVWLAGVLAAGFSLMIVGSALAAQPAPGKWSGTSGPSLSFDVSGSRNQMTSFTVADLVVDCYPPGGNSYSTTVTFYIPSVDVKPDGSFDTTYEQTDSSGQPD